VHARLALEQKNDSALFFLSGWQGSIEDFLSLDCGGYENVFSFPPKLRAVLMLDIPEAAAAPV